MEENHVTFLLDCTALDVTKFPSARVLKASFEGVDERRLVKASPECLFQGPRAVVFPWLEQLAALPQLTRVVLNCGEFSPGKVLTQLPAGCKLVVYTSATEWSASLPHCASLPHLVKLCVEIGFPTCTTLVDFKCLAGCPHLRDVRLSIDDCCRDCYFEDPNWVNLSTLMICHPAARLFWVSEMLACT